MGREGIGNRFSFQTGAKTGKKFEIDGGGNGHNLVGMRGNGHNGHSQSHSHSRVNDLLTACRLTSTADGLTE